MLSAVPTTRRPTNRECSQLSSVVIIGGRTGLDRRRPVEFEGAVQAEAEGAAQSSLRMSLISQVTRGRRLQWDGAFRV